MKKINLSIRVIFLPFCNKNKFPKETEKKNNSKKIINNILLTEFIRCLFLVKLKNRNKI